MVSALSRMDKFWKALSRLFRTKLVWWIVGLLFIGFLLWLLVPSFTPLANAFGWILTNLSKICNFLLVVAGAACAIRPRKMAEIEQNPRRLRLLGISLFVVATTAFISDLYNSSQIDSQIRQLSSSGQ